MVHILLYPALYTDGNKSVYRLTDDRGVEHAVINVVRNMFFEVTCEVGYRAGIPQVLSYVVCDEESPLYRAFKFVEWSLDATILYE